MKIFKVKIPAISSQEITEEAKSKDEFRKSIFEKLGIEIEKVSKDDIDFSLYYQRSTRYKGKKLGKSVRYKIWREAVFERDNYTCVFCKRKKEVSGKLNADHIKPFAYFPKLRFDLNNGRTLCEECHKKTDTFGYNVHKKIKLCLKSQLSTDSSIMD